MCTEGLEVWGGVICFNDRSLMDWFWLQVCCPGQLSQHCRHPTDRGLERPHQPITHRDDGEGPALSSWWFQNQVAQKASLGCPAPSKETQHPNKGFWACTGRLAPQDVTDSTLRFLALLTPLRSHWPARQASDDTRPAAATKPLDFLHLEHSSGVHRHHYGASFRSPLTCSLRESFFLICPYSTCQHFTENICLLVCCLSFWTKMQIQRGLGFFGFLHFGIFST